MIYSKRLLPLFRDSEANGSIGLRGYMYMFQDTAGGHSHSLGKGNDTLPYDYNASWIYTKYRLHIFEESDFSDLLDIQTWIEPLRSKMSTWQGINYMRDGRLMASGRLEAYLLDRDNGRLAKISRVEFPTDVTEDKHPSVDGFRKLRFGVEGMTGRIEHKVVYTEIDNSHHMTNLRYVDLLMNAFDCEFYEKWRPVDFEIHFEAQCFEGETLYVYADEISHDDPMLGDTGEDATDGSRFFKMAVKKEDGSIAVRAIMQFAPSAQGEGYAHVVHASEISDAVSKQYSKNVSLE